MILGTVILVNCIYLMFDRDYYLPFLGKCAMPSYVFKSDTEVNDDKRVSVLLKNLPPHTQIIYWASIPTDNVINDPKLAYGNYQNSGTTISNEFGEATAKINCPSNYTVGMLKYKLHKHLHYRYAIPEYKGLYSEIFTAKVEC